MKKIILAVITVTLLLSTLSGCDLFSKTQKDSDVIAIDGDEQKLSESIENMIKDYKLSGSFSGVSESMVINSYLTIQEQHPEYFWISNGYSLDIATAGDSVIITLNITSDADMNAVPKRVEELTEETAKIVSLAENLSNDYEKALFVHDYLIDNTEYDKVSYDEMVADTMGQKIYDASTAYGCIVEKKAVCSGYATAYQHIMGELGIECGKVSGKKNDGEDHQWNYVKLGSEYYYVDVTWDDPINEEGISTKSYEFFGLTTDELRNTHVINMVGFVPECTATKYNYFIYNGLYFETYDFNSVKAAILKNLSKDRIEIKFATNKELCRAVSDLLDNNKIFDIPNIPAEDFYYSESESGKVLSLFFNMR